MNLSYIKNLTYHNVPYLFHLNLCYIYVRCFYSIVFNLLKNTNKKFNTLSNYKQKYITKNIVKSFNLLFLLLHSTPNIIYPIYFYNTWNNNLLYKAALFYSSNDLAALTYISKLPSNTRNHHITTTVLSIISVNIDFNSSLLGKMIFIYCFFSTIAFPVNIYLGMRHLYKEEKLVTFKKYTRNIYALSLSLNWSWHIFTSIKNYNTLGISHLIYFFCLFWIIKDDIILMKWLNN